MRAIVLAGGEGTRMRPLTRRTPKVLVPVLNRPLLAHLLANLRAHGFDQVTVALTHGADADAIRQWFQAGEDLGQSLDYGIEDVPLGSGGAIALIASGWRETFLVCNGDIITDLNLTSMLVAHRTRGAELSLSLYEVDDPSPFGVADPDETGRIRRFVEKPPRELAPSHQVNSGAWLFEPSLLEQMDGSRFSRVEDTLFPSLCAQGRAVYGYRHQGYWADVGTPDALLRVNMDLARDAAADGVVRADRTTIAVDAQITGPAVIGTGTRIATGAAVQGSVLWDNVTIGAGAVVRDSIIASGATIGADAQVVDSVVAHGAEIAPGARLVGATIEPATFVAAGVTP